MDFEYSLHYATLLKEGTLEEGLFSGIKNAFKNTKNVGNAIDVYNAACVELAKKMLGESNDTKIAQAIINKFSFNANAQKAVKNALIQQIKQAGKQAQANLKQQQKQQKQQTKDQLAQAKDLKAESYRAERLRRMLENEETQASLENNQTSKFDAQITKLAEFSKQMQNGTLTAQQVPEFCKFISSDPAFEETKQKYNKFLSNFSNGEASNNESTSAAPAADVNNGAVTASQDAAGGESVEQPETETSQSSVTNQDNAGDPAAAEAQASAGQKPSWKQTFTNYFDKINDIDTKNGFLRMMGGIGKAAAQASGQQGAQPKLKQEIDAFAKQIVDNFEENKRLNYAYILNESADPFAEFDKMTGFTGADEKDLCRPFDEGYAHCQQAMQNGKCGPQPKKVPYPRNSKEAEDYVSGWELAWMDGDDFIRR